MHFKGLIYALTISPGLVELVMAAQQQEGIWSRGRHSRFNASQSISSTSLAASTANTATTATIAAAVNGTSSLGSVVASATASTTGGNNNVGTAGSGGNNNLALNPSLVQTGSQNIGLKESGGETGQTPSATDTANFINFCAGKTLTDGLQVKGGSCNGIVMGNIPPSTNMVSTIITSPEPGQIIAPNSSFNVSLQVANLAPGSFTNAKATYYAAPQDLSGGKVVGHIHVTIQTLGKSLAATTPPDASTFAFFKGIDDVGNGRGGLSATVTGGLPAGSYRVCTMSSASNHQPVLMPVAQRGAQDDCTKFTVGSAANVGSAGGSGAGAASASDSVSSSAAAGSSRTSTASAAAGSATATAGKQSGQGGKAGGRVRFARRALVV